MVYHREMRMTRRMTKMMEKKMRMVFMVYADEDDFVGDASELCEVPDSPPPWAV